MKLELVPVIGQREYPGKTISYPPEPGQEHVFDGFGHSEVLFRVYAENKHSRKLVGQTPEPLVSWSQPKVLVQEPPNSLRYGSVRFPNRLGFRLETPKMVDPDERREAGARLQYRLDGGSWTDLQYTEYGYVTEELTPGREYSGEVRMILTENVGDQEFADTHRVTGMVPVSAEPRKIPLGEPSAYDPEHVRIPWPRLSLEDTGGWSAHGYSLGSGTSSGVTQWDNGDIVLPGGNSQISIDWRGQPAGENTSRTIPQVQSESVSVGDVSTFAFDSATHKLTVAVNYALEGSECTVLDANGATLDTIAAVNGRVYKSQAYVSPGDGAPKPVEKFRVNCTINGNSSRWTWDNVERK